MTVWTTLYRIIASFGLLFSIIAIILTTVGISWDATGFLLSTLHTCVSAQFSDLGQEYAVYGDTDLSKVTAAEVCASVYTTRDCICISGDEGSWDCHTFDMNVNTCEPLLTTLPPLFITSFSFLVFMLVGSIVYSCCTCCTLCCHNSSPVHPAAPVPVLATYQPGAQPIVVDTVATNIYAAVPMDNAQQGAKVDPTIAAQPIAMAYAI